MDNNVPSFKVRLHRMQAAAGPPTCFKFKDTFKTPKHPNPTAASSNKAVPLPQIFTNWMQAAPGFPNSLVSPFSN